MEIIETNQNHTTWCSKLFIDFCVICDTKRCTSSVSDELDQFKVHLTSVCQHNTDPLRRFGARHSRIAAEYCDYIPLFCFDCKKMTAISPWTDRRGRGYKWLKALISIQKEITVPKSSVELYIIDEQFPNNFEELQTATSGFTVTTTCDSPDKTILAKGHDNSNLFHVESFTFTAYSTANGVYAIVLTVNIEGQPCADEKQYGVLSYNQSGNFMSNWRVQSCSRSGFMSLVWSNDNTQILFMKWQTSKSSETVLDEETVPQIRKHQLSKRYAQNWEICFERKKCHA